VNPVARDGTTSGEGAGEGRIASLLEVARAHPELTGQKIFPNGAILGMTRPKSKGILMSVAFSGVEEFMITGQTLFQWMYVRLRFGGGDIWTGD